MNVNAPLTKIKDLREAANTATLIQLLASKKGLADALNELADTLEANDKAVARIAAEEAVRTRQLADIEAAEAKSLKAIEAASGRLETYELDLADKVEVYDLKLEEITTRESTLARNEKAVAVATKNVEKQQSEIDAVEAGHTKRADKAVSKAEVREAAAAGREDAAEYAKTEYEALTDRIKAAIPSEG